MSNQAKPIPEGFHTVTPYLVCRDAAGAIDFYKKAFGAEEIFRMPGPAGQGVMHAEIQIGDSYVMVSDEMPRMEHWGSPQKLNGTTVCIHLYVEDVDAACEKAVAAGATVSMPVMDAFWGDRYGRLTDPFGHHWSIATHKQDLTPEEIAKGAEEFFKNMGGG